MQHATDKLDAPQDVVFTKGDGAPVNLTAAAGLFASAAMMMHEEGEVSTHQHPDTSDNSHHPVSMEGALGLGAVPRRRRGSVPDTATTEAGARHSPDVDVQQAKRYVT